MISLVLFDIALTAARPPQSSQLCMGRTRLVSVITSDDPQSNHAQAPFKATHQAKARDAN